MDSKDDKQTGFVSETKFEMGRRQLKRVQIVIDVLFALLLFSLFQFLPRPDVDHFTRETMVQAFADSYINYLVILVGIVLILIYWNQNNLLFGNLERSNGTHATLSILSIFSLMLYLYFVRLDMELDSTTLALQMQSITLALSGFLGIYSWHYAIKKKLITDKLTGVEQDAVYLKLLPEPVVALISFPFAWLGPDGWTLSWLLLIPVSWVLKKYRIHLKFLALRESETK